MATTTGDGVTHLTIRNLLEQLGKMIEAGHDLDTHIIVRVQQEPAVHSPGSGIRLKYAVAPARAVFTSRGGGRTPLVLEACVHGFVEGNQKALGEYHAWKDRRA